MRAFVRLCSGGSLVVSILLWSLAGAFVLDFFLIRMGRLERGIVLAIMLGGLVLAFLRYLLPAMRVSESDTMLALMVDNRQGMHSDLVAAIQFEDEYRLQYGSADLREAVVEYTGEAAGGLNFLEGSSREKLWQRLGIFAITAVVCLLPAGIFWRHTGAFFNRLLLGTSRYPTDVVIVAIESPGETVAYGHSVEFRVRIAVKEGKPWPADGVVKVETATSALETDVQLVRDEKEPDVYAGTLDRVLDDLEYVIYIGDTSSDRKTLTLLPLPLAELEMTVITPVYAQAKHKARPQNRRQVVVLEGSKVIPRVKADKKLRSATLTIRKGKKVLATYPMQPDGKAFKLDQKTGPLATVNDVVHFTIEVTDTDGLSPENAITGVVHITADLPPRVALGAHSRLVVPTATPELKFRAIDDYALSRLVLHQTILRVGGEEAQTEKSTVVATPTEHQADLTGKYKLNLEGMKLQKGDQVVVAIEAFDYRGKGAEVKSRRSEKWVFDVTDQAGILRGMGRLDEQMDKRLDEILQAQLEAGS